VNATAGDPHGDAHLQALSSSVNRLRGLVEPLTDDDLTAGAYPSEWSIADVLSHLGSGAVITRRRLEDVLAGRETPDGFAPGVWDVWNSKSPAAQRADALEADSALMAALEAVPVEDRERVSLAMGPMTQGFAEFVGMRLNEHAFHTWDIEVANEPTATLPSQAAALVVDNLELVAGFTAKPTGDIRTVIATTSEPRRTFSIDLTTDRVTMQVVAGTPSGVDFELPAEAFSRLVYGRLDPEHTPHGNHPDALNILRRAFPGP
jgi:uncharacterized protein (TIGR03083 family)